MPICKKCNDSFPVRLKIDGKIKNLQRRKYCFSCSPYGLHNTRKLEELTNVNNPNSSARVCESCDRKYIYDRSKGHRATSCNSCGSNKKRRGMKQKCIDYKGGKCIICSYNKCNSALVFHHLKEDKKSFGINYAMSFGWKKLKKELDKCILLCNRCHSEIHNGMTAIPTITRI